MGRYNGSPVINFGSQYGTSEIISQIRNGIKTGSIRYTVHVLQDGERLDTLAGQFYGDATLFWIISSSSSVGWGLQCPPGTLIKIPNISDVNLVVRR